nr:hypothetical protein [Pantoea sp. 201603H]
MQMDLDTLTAAAHRPVIAGPVTAHGYGIGFFSDGVGRNIGQGVPVSR